MLCLLTQACTHAETHSHCSWVKYMVQGSICSPQEIITANSAQQGPRYPSFHPKLPSPAASPHSLLYQEPILPISKPLDFGLIFFFKPVMSPLILTFSATDDAVLVPQSPTSSSFSCPFKSRSNILFVLLFFFCFIHISSSLGPLALKVKELMQGSVSINLIFIHSAPFITISSPPSTSQ